MKVTKEDLPQREALLTIELEQQDMEPHLQRAYQRIVQRSNIPGFRKGKAPRAIVERFVGPGALREEALDSLLPDAIKRAIEEQKLDSAGMPRVNEIDGDPPIVKATVPLEPLVELDDYLAIRADEEKAEVSEEQVQELLEQLRGEQAPWEPTNRPVAFGDQVAMDVRGVVNGRDILNQDGVVYVAAEENPSPLPGFVQELVGMKPGGEKEFTLTVPEGYGNDDLIGSECTFYVAVHENKEKRLPELNDEFAKGVGEGYDSLKALEEKMRADLQSQEEQAARRRHEDKVVPLLLERTKVELSPLLVDHEVAHLLEDERESLRRQQVDMEQYLQNVGKSAEEHQEELRSVALSRLTRSYALRKIAELENIEVSPEDVEQEINTLVESVGNQGDAIRRNFDSPEGQRSLSEVLLNRKTLERLTEIAKGQQSAPAGAAKEQSAEASGPGGREDAGTT